MGKEFDKTRERCSASKGFIKEGKGCQKRLIDTILSPITIKELGWYDADGDKINEVDDPCPFDKTNKCTR